jgi:hypothetical protein
LRDDFRIFFTEKMTIMNKVLIILLAERLSVEVWKETKNEVITIDGSLKKRLKN